MTQVDVPVEKRQPFMQAAHDRFMQYGEEHVGPYPHTYAYETDEGSNLVYVSFNNELRAQQRAWRIKVAASGVVACLRRVGHGFFDNENGV